MRASDINPEDYFLSGATETSLVYLATPFMAGARSVNDTGLLLFEEGFGTGYVGKKGATASKDKWLATSIAQLDDEFSRWQKKWNEFDDELYNMATKAQANDWRVNWQRIDEINREFWLESYKLDTLDPFAEQLEREVLSGMVKTKIDADMLSELVAPAEATLPQQMEAALADVRQDTMTRENYLRKYWFKYGTWNGGSLFSAADLDKELAADVSIEELNEVLSARARLHKRLDEQLNESTLQLVNLLRVLTEWREVRKSSAQRLSLGLLTVTQQAADALGVDAKIIRWAQIDEVDQVADSPETFAERSRLSVYVIDDRNPECIMGEEAGAIIKKFKPEVHSAAVEGMTAAPGQARGLARIVLKVSEFSKFQDREILITSMTRPEFTPLMRRAAAIVTDEGGLTSHAAIISRELNIPCIIGTKTATKVFKDGDLVEVDALPQDPTFGKDSAGRQGKQGKGVVRKI